MSTISIVTTSFNAAATIRETIESIVSQTGNLTVEHIITDAGSTDGTPEIVQSYGNKVRFVSTPGLNQAEGINAGFKLATGSIVAFLNADDTYEPGALQKVAQAFKANPDSKWLIGRCRIINERGLEMQSWITKYKNLLLDWYSYPLLLTENFICQPSVFFRKDIFNQYGYLSEDQHYVMDYEFWLRIGEKERPLVIPEYLACFRRFAGTKSNSGFVQQFKDDKAVAKHYAIKSRKHWTIPFKCFNHFKTIGIYKLLYR